MNLWRQVPVELKMDKYLYRAYLSSRDPYSLFASDAPTGGGDFAGDTGATLRSHVKSLLNASWPTAQLMRVKTRFDARIKEYRRDPLGLATVYSFGDFVFQNREKRNVLSLLVNDFVDQEYGVRRSSIRAYANKLNSGDDADDA